MHNVINHTCPYQGFQFPFQSKLSFEPILKFWNEDERLRNGWGKELRIKLIDYIEKYPELAKPIEDPSILKQHKEFIDTVMMAVFPPGLQDDEMVAATQPYAMEVVHATKRFQDSLMTPSGSVKMDHANFSEEEMLFTKTLNAYSSILETIYGEKIGFKGNMNYTLKDPVSGFVKYYKIEINTRFTEVFAKENAPKLSKQEVENLKRKFDDLSIWIEHLPPEHFEIHGLVVFRLIDVTIEETLSSLKFLLLEDDSLINPNKFQNVKEKISSLLNISALEFGVSVFNETRNTFIEPQNDIKNSLILSGISPNTDCKEYFGTFPCQIESTKKPLFFEDILEVENPPPFLKALAKQGIRNLFVAPLYQGSQFVGLLELGTKTPRKMGTMAALNLVDILPLFSIAVKRNADKVESRIQKTIKENFTAIHPSVEWKFVDSAMKMITTMDREENVTIEPILFQEVFPLYGASDIRNSSSVRSKSIQEDLLAHLSLASEVLEVGFKQYNMPILDELSYKVSKYHEHIKQGLYSGDEIEVLEFLQFDVEPCFRHMEADSPNDVVNNSLSNYWMAIRNNLGVLYNKRKDFEDSLTKINETLSLVIDEAEAEAQKMFPHYFEKYKTDGVEYNIYVGEALTKERQFNPVHLKNLRIWQLVTMHKSAQAAEKIKPYLPIPLSTTHLILAQSNPLSIKFRIDEKKFDVDGAYNIRYEIVKKRIDKALIKGTEERLTQPEKIAIVYSQPKEAAEYRGYLEYLAARGLIYPEIEELELEDLQGVQGLKGLRVTMKFETEQLEKVKLNGTKSTKIDEAVVV